MEQVFNWIVQHWRIVVYCCLVICQVVLFLVRKKPIKVVDSVEDLILKTIPGFIVYVEEQIGSGHGEVKLTRVIELVSEFLKEKYPDLDVGIYIDFIKSNVEYILSTPQKKGENVDEK